MNGAESGFEIILPSDEGENGSNIPASAIERPRKLVTHSTSKIFATFQRLSGPMGNRKMEGFDKTLCAECTEVNFMPDCENYLHNTNNRLLLEDLKRKSRS